MFDMIDDIEMDYVPTINNKSRSGTMKKLTKKQPKAPAKVQKKVNLNSYDDFSDLLDDQLEKGVKNVSGLGNKSGGNHLKSKKESFQFFDDEPKSKSVDKPATKLTIKDETPSFSPAKGKKWGEASDDIISEDNNFSKNISRNTNKPTMTTINPSFNVSKNEKVDDQPVFASSRMMKPPLRKQDSQTSIKSPALAGTGGGFNLTIPEEPTNLSLSSKAEKKEDDDIIRPPPRLMGKRLSTENKNEESKFSINMGSQTLTLGDKKEAKKQESSMSKGLFLTVDQPKSKKKEESGPFFSFSKERQPQPSRSLGKQPFSQERQSKSIEKPRQELRIQPKTQGLGLKMQQSVTMKESNNMPMSNIVTTKTGVYGGQDFTKQIELMKGAFQKQIDFLQQNLQRQIKINTQTRQKVVNESNKMIQDERSRTKKLYEEELKRQKQLFDWQKKRMEDNYTTQIQTLKQSVEYNKQTNQLSSYRPQYDAKGEVEYLELQLKNQKKILADRQRIIQKRQFDLHERQQQMVKRRKREEQRLRDEQKKLLQMQSKIKKNSLDDKKNMSQEKQHMAVQLAHLQIQAKKKMQKAELCIKQNKMVRQALQKQKTQLRLVNAELMSRYKAKSLQMQQQKERVKLIQQQLIKKLRIVELKSREVNPANTSVNKTTYKNNWVDDKSASQLRSMSVQKHNKNDNSISYGRGTKQRFNQLQSNTKSKINISVRDNKKFDLQNYMNTVQNYNKIKSHA